MLKESAQSLRRGPPGSAAHLLRFDFLDFHAFSDNILVGHCWSSKGRQHFGVAVEKVVQSQLYLSGTIFQRRNGLKNVFYLRGYACSLEKKTPKITRRLFPNKNYWRLFYENQRKRARPLSSMGSLFFHVYLVLVGTSLLADAAEWPVGPSLKQGRSKISKKCIINFNKSNCILKMRS